MWIVTWENKRTGKWVSDPEGPFIRKKDAVKYIKDCRDCLLPDNQLVLYRCDLISQTIGM